MTDEMEFLITRVDDGGNPEVFLAEREMDDLFDLLKRANRGEVQGLTEKERGRLNGVLAKLVCARRVVLTCSDESCEEEAEFETVNAQGWFCCEKHKNDDDACSEDFQRIPCCPKCGSHVCGHGDAS